MKQLPRLHFFKKQLFVCRAITLDVETDEEREEISNEYQLLPTSQDNEVEFGYSTFDGAEFHVSTARDYRNLIRPDHTRPEDTATVNDEEACPPLDPTNVETIKEIMSNFSLPTASIPSWAVTVTDDQLKKVVEDKVTKKSEENWAVFD